jgi:nucleoside-diphosphate-sugar epimerase
MALATKGVDSVIALAALVGDAACDLDVDETMSINMESTRLLAEACLRSRVQRLVFASSCSVYGANSELVLNEGSWLNPVSLYAQTRIQSEKELLRHTEDLSVVILRLATVFGLSRRMRFDLVVNTFAAHGFFNGKIQVFGGKQWRPNLHVQDAAEAFILASQAEDRKVRGEIFNVGNNALNYPIAELARLVQVVLPKVKVEISAEVTDQRDYRVSFDKIRNVLGFQTQFTVMSGLQEIISAFEDGEIITPHAEQYHNYRYLKTYGFQGAVAAHSTTREAPASL